jgi:hypothetical protein
MSIDEVERLEVDASDYTETAPGAASRLAQLAEIADDPPTLPKESDQVVLDGAIQRIRALLSSAQDTAHVAELRTQVIPELDAIRKELRKLPEADTVIRAMATAEMIRPLETRQDEFAEAMRQAFIRKIGRRTADFLAFVIAAAIAVFTALSQLYVGKAWGTWIDQVAILVWAFGATAVLTDVLQALLNFMQRAPATGVLAK